MGRLELVVVFVACGIDLLLKQFLTFEDLPL